MGAQKSVKNLPKYSREIRVAVVRNGEQRSDPKYISEVESTGFADGLMHDVRNKLG